MVFDPVYFLYVAPAMLLAFLAQMWISSAYGVARRIPARLSGAAAARRMLDAEGLTHVGIEQVPGQLSDHYDPRAKVLRLSTDVFHGRSLAAVGIAAHEAGHAIQDAQGYLPLVLRNLAVPAANFGSGFGVTLIVLGMVLGGIQPLMWAGVILFSGVVLFQVINLPVEFDASSRARRDIQELGFVDAEEMPYVRSVLNAAALTYVAGTLQSILTLLYFLRFVRGSSDRR